MIPEKWETGFPIRIVLKQGSPGETFAAYGEMVWFWRRDPGATLLVRPSELRGQERPLPGKSTYNP